MKIKEIASCVNAMFRARILNQRIPFIVSWALTYKCNTRCAYCSLCDISLKELDTSTLLSIFDELVNLGMQWVVFTGGEPLLREDIGDIIKHASRANVHTSLSSNGILLKEKLNSLKWINRINISFDGPIEVHDRLRGEGTHDRVISAMKEASRLGIPVTLTAVISNANIQHLDYILEIAEKFGSKVLFQPISEFGSNDIHMLSPDRNRYKEAIGRLINEKKENNGVILNSLAGLKHIACWPKPTGISCFGGKLYFRVEPDGSINTCPRLFFNYGSRTQDILKLRVKGAIQRLLISSCKSCWCAQMVEFNLGSSFHPSAAINILKRMKF